MDTAIIFTITSQNHLVYNKILSTSVDDALLTIRKTFKRAQLKNVFVFDSQALEMLTEKSYKRYKVNVYSYVIVCYRCNNVCLSFETNICNADEVKVLATGLKKFFFYDCVAILSKDNDKIIDIIE